MRAGELVLGVSNAPMYGELAWAEKGGGAFLNERRIHVSEIATLSRAYVSTGNLKSLTCSARCRRLGALIRRVSKISGYGDFVHYHLLARGLLDVVIESDVNILDISALTVIVREAGGRVTDLQGQPVGLNTQSVLPTGICTRRFCKDYPSSSFLRLAEIEWNARGATVWWSYVKNTAPAVQSYTGSNPR